MTLIGTSDTRAVILSALLVVAAVAGVTVVAGGSAAAQDSAEVSYQGETFKQIAIGDPIRSPYTIQLNDTEYATVVFTGARNTETDFWANVTLHDSDGDGIVKLHINTWEMGHSAPFEAESGEVTAWDQDELPDDRLLNKSKSTEQSAYELYLGSGQDAAGVLASHSATARLRIEEAETESIEPITAPRGSEFNDLSQVYMGSGPFGDPKPGMSPEGDRIIAAGDTLLLLPFGGGYYGAAEHAIEETGDKDQALLWLLENGYYEFELAQNATDPKVLDIEHAIEEDQLQFANGLQYYHVMFALNTSAEVFQVNGEGEYVAPEPGEVYQAKFRKAGRIDPSLDEAALRTVFLNVSVVEPRAMGDPPTVTLQDGKIGGVTTLAPGTNLTVYVGLSEDEVRRGTLVKTTIPREDTVTSGIAEHPFNFSIDIEDTDANSVTFAVWAEGYGRIGAFPPDADIGPTTTIAPGQTTEPAETTTSGDDGTTTAATESTTDPGDGGDGGAGGLIPGFTASVALIALLAAALLAVRRSR